MQLIKRADHSLYDTTEAIILKDGSEISRSPKGVGAVNDRWVTVQKNYTSEIIPFKEFLEAQEAEQKRYPLFQFECVSYNTCTKEIRFEACPYFDTQDEPVITESVLYDSKKKCLKMLKRNFKITHKWLLVKDDYLGFNVQEAYNRSKIQEDI